jgi:hypothetical protein
MMKKEYVDAIVIFFPNIHFKKVRKVTINPSGDSGFHFDIS